MTTFGAEDDVIIEVRVGLQLVGFSFGSGSVAPLPLLRPRMESATNRGLPLSATLRDPSRSQVAGTSSLHILIQTDVTPLDNY